MFKNIKVVGKLSLGFGIILLFLITLGIISLQKMNQVNNQSTIIAENWMPSIRVVQDINANTSDFRLFEFAHVLSQTPEEMRKVEEKISEILSTMNKNRATYEKLISTVNEQNIYDSFSKKFDQYLNIHNELISISKQNKTMEGQKILHDSEALFNEFSAEAIKLVEINIAGGNKASLEGDEIYEHAKIIMISVIIISILMGIAVAFFISRSITSSLNQLQNGLFTFFGYLNRESSSVELIKLDSKDEFGEMSKIINQNIVKTQKSIDEDRKLIDETISVLSEFEQGDLYQRLTASSSNPSLMELKSVLNNMANNLEKNINNILKIIEEFSNYNYLRAPLKISQFS